MNNFQEHSLTKSEYRIIEQTSAYLLLEHRKSKQKTFYKEFFAADLTCSEAAIIHEDFHRRKNCKNANLIELYSNFCSSNDPGETSNNKIKKQYKYGMLYEYWTRDFDSEIKKKIGTTSYWSEEELLNTLEAILDGLTTLHTNGIVHGDIKAKNIVVTSDGFVKLADQYVTSTVYKKSLSQMISDKESYLAPEVLTVCANNNHFHQRRVSDPLNDDILAIRNMSSNLPLNIVGKNNSQVTPYETPENDLWAVGLVFLEASILQNLRGVYDWEKGQLNSFLLLKKIEIMEAIYGKDRLMCKIIKSLLAKAPDQRKQALTILGKRQQEATNLKKIQDQLPDRTENAWGSFDSKYQSIPSDVDELRPLDKLTNSFTAKIGFISKKSFENLEEVDEPKQRSGSKTRPVNLQKQEISSKQEVSACQEEFVRQVREEILKRQKSIQRLNSLLITAHQPDSILKEVKKKADVSVDYSKSAQAKIVSDYYFEETSEFNDASLIVQENSKTRPKKTLNKNGKSVDLSHQGFSNSTSINGKKGTEIEINLMTFMKSLAKMTSSEDGGLKKPVDFLASAESVNKTLEKSISLVSTPERTNRNKAFLNIDSLSNEADSPSFNDIYQTKRNPVKNTINTASKMKISPINKVFEGTYSEGDQKLNQRNYYPKKVGNETPQKICTNNKIVLHKNQIEDYSQEQVIYERAGTPESYRAPHTDINRAFQLLEFQERETFNPTGDISRESVSSFIQEQILKKIGREEDNLSPVSQRSSMNSTAINRSLSNSKNDNRSELQASSSASIPNVWPLSEAQQAGLAKGEANQTLIEKHKGEKIRKLIYENGDYYEGQTLGVTRQGYGTLYAKEGKVIYQGEWHKDRYHGYGILRNKHMMVRDEETFINFKDFSSERNSWYKYEGYFKDGHRQGIGTLIFFTKEVFKGDFEGGKASGKGLFIFANNEKIEGIWRNNKLEQLLQMN